MNNQINLSLLQPYLKTTYHTREILIAIDQLQTAFFQKKQSFLKTLEVEIPFPLSETLKKLAEDHQINLENAADTDMFFGDVREAIQQIPVLTLTLSFSPTMSMIDKIYGWLGLNAHNQIMLDFKVDESLIGGAQITFKGKYKDFSLKHEMTPTIQELIKI